MLLTNPITADGGYSPCLIKYLLIASVVEREAALEVGAGAGPGEVEGVVAGDEGHGDFVEVGAEIVFAAVRAEKDHLQIAVQAAA